MISPYLDSQFYGTEAIFSYYSDGSRVYYQINGVSQGYVSLIPNGAYKLNISTTTLTNSYVFSNIRFYPTGNRGPVGQGFATLVETGAQVLGPGEIGYMNMGLYNQLPTMQMGNVARVDDIYGADSTGYIGGLAYKTVQGAIADIVAGSLTGITIWVLPGTYDLPEAGITIPDDCSIRGVSVQTCILQRVNATADTTLIMMGTSSRLEDLTLKLTSAGHYNLTGIVFGGTTTKDAKLRTCVLTVNNSAASTAGTSDVYGIHCNGSSGAGPESFSFNSLKGSTVNVLSNGGGKKRGVLISAANSVTSRDFNIYVAKPRETASIGSYIGVETNDSTSAGSIQLRSTTIGTITPVYQDTVANIQKYTSADIYQTKPETIDNPSYLQASGIQVGPGTDLVAKNAGGRPFSTYVYPTVIAYGLKGSLVSGQNGFLWTGTQAVGLGTFPDQSGTFGDLHLNVTNVGGGGGSTNRVTVLSTVGLIANMPVKFSRDYGSIVATDTYFIHSVVDSTHFRISSLRYGAVFSTSNPGAVPPESPLTAVIITTYPVSVLSTDVSNQLTLSASTGSEIVAGMPVVFSDWFGTVAEGTPYYINSVSGAIMTLSPTATLGTTLSTGIFTARPDTTGIVYTGTTQVTASNTAGTLTLLNSGGYVVGMPIVFRANIGTGIVGGTLYYIRTVVSSDQIRVASIYNGTVVTTTATGPIAIEAYIFNSPTVPAYFRVQQPMILSGMNVALGTPAGAIDTVIVYIYRTPANANQFTGLTLINSFTTTFDNATTISKGYYNSSKAFGAGDKIHVYVRFTSATTAHDMTVQLDCF
jgi:hypothetical protein